MNDPAAAARAEILLCTKDPRDRDLFESLAGGAAWRIHHAPEFADAVSTLARRAISAVVCDADQGGELWRRLLSVTDGGASRPRVIVLSRLPHERLWAEVLNLGAYDLLMKPLDPAEARRVLMMAMST
jgi:DNA-binding response OmpR family regulator